MNPLPQRKKTAEEIAKLRESLGVPDVVPPAAAPRPSAQAPPPSPLPGPSAEPPPPPADPESAPESAPVPTAEAEPVVLGEEVRLREPKPIRSLRKSERQPLPERRPPPPDGAPVGGASLPTRRRSDRELNDLRRRAAMETRPPVAHLQSITAHPVLLGLGYLLALAGGIGGLVVAAFIFRKKPRSTHHAGFMAVIAVFVIVFGALYLFPQLRHAS